MSNITVEHNPAPVKLETMGVYDWPVWTKEVSTFPWSYDQNEMCYFLEGKVTVTPDGGDPVTMGEGDLVSFPKGMSCTWEISEPVTKHYHLY